MNDEDKKLLEIIGNVDPDKIIAAQKQRNADIEYALEVISAEEENLSDWEADFYYDIMLRHTKGQKITDAQFDKLMEVSYKYDV